MINESNMVYAPVIITTLCRYNHFVRCIESLKNNTWAKYTDIYIGLDYPKKQSHWEGYEKICKYLDGEFYEFKSFNVIKRMNNYGSLRNMKELREHVFENFDRVIRTDDDAEFSPNFLEYMDKCLMYYEYSEDIIGVTGYSYPIDWIVDRNANVFEENFIFPMWGTGLWREKYRKFEKDLQNGYLRHKFPNYLRSMETHKLIDSKFVDYVNGALCWLDNSLIDSVTDVSLGIYLTLEKKRIVMPTISKVRNHGFDGTGEYCEKIAREEVYLENIHAGNYNYSKQSIDKEKNFDLVPDSKDNTEINKMLMNNFDIRSKQEMNKVKLKIFFYKVFGKVIYKKIWSIKNKTKK